MAWAARWDTRAKRWPIGLRWLYLVIKWFLVVMGAYLLVGHYVLTWGWAAAIWLLMAPLLYGVFLGWPTDPSPPSSNSPSP